MQKNINMKKISYIVFFIVVSFSVSLNAQSGEIKKVSAKEFYDISKSMDCPIVDIRTSKEFNKEHLANAVNIDFYDRSFYDKLDRYKNNTLLLYDRSGNRIGQAIDKLKDNNFTKVYVLDEGLVGWKRVGYEVEK